MTFVKSALVAGAALAALTAGTLAASTASAATTYIVCNSYNECWKVHQKYTDYPADQRIVYRDNAWWMSHDKDAHWRFLADPASDHGWYDKDGDWHPFAP